MEHQLSSVDSKVTFTDVNELSHWRMVSDSVMGGVSTSHLNIEAVPEHYAEQAMGLYHQSLNQYALFTGVISLENNGGFSSVYRAIDTVASNINKVILHVVGDGKVYQLRINTIVDGYPLAYQHQFATSDNVLEHYQLSFSDFSATFRGRLLANAPPLLAENISEVGFLLNPKQAGAFSLAIVAIEFI